MEMSRGHKISVRRAWQYMAMLLLLSPIAVHAQGTKPGYVAPQYIIDDGKMIITLDMHITDSVLNNFVSLFNLADLDLTDLVKKNIGDSLHKKGWSVEIKSNGLVILSKRLDELQSAIKEKDEQKEKKEAHERPEPAEKPELVELSQMLASIGEKASGLPANSSNLSGANHFINKSPFHVADSVVTFYMRGRQDAKKVCLAGNFTDWQHGMMGMTKTDSGWIANVSLGAGKYLYKFVVDGNWMTDNDNKLVENDGNGSGNDNSVYYKTNKVFTLRGFPTAKSVMLAGSFNKWATDDIIMAQTPTGWQVPVFLSPGTYTYRFIVDGHWMADPDNELKLPNEYNGYNSLIQVGAPYLFKLQGHTDAKAVVLAGSFNTWQTDQLYMFKTATGWELPYVLGPGNYEYKFIVDGNWISDPANPIKVVDGNSYFVLSPNYTFHLKGFPDAKQVYLAGDFDDWASEALLMHHEGNEWTYSVYLSPGKHLYKFIVDGHWMKDPDNSLWEDNDNSIIWEKK